MDHTKPNTAKNISLTIDGFKVTVPEGTRILEAAQKVGVYIPTLCDHRDLCKRSVCRLCVVECDGRGKLMAACANEVSEGMNIVTNNLRILTIRKTIIELLLANHPQECLRCVRNNNCELQTLSEYLLIREPTYIHDETGRKPVVTESNVLVYDKGKCVKCGRCVETCQEVQTIRAINSSHRGINYEIRTPYDQTHAESPCVFCGQCAEVCPTGAILEFEQTKEVYAALNDKDCQVMIQFDPLISTMVNDSLGLKPMTVTAEKIITALKYIGFKGIYNSRFYTNKISDLENEELQKRIQNRKKIPMISGCSDGVNKFIEYFYPDLKDNLCRTGNSRQLFNTLNAKPDSRIKTVSVVPCLAQKYQESSSGIVLTVREFAAIFNLYGINFNSLPESVFDTPSGDEAPTVKNPEKTLIVNGYAAARPVLDSVLKGECDASMIRILSCPRTDHPGCPYLMPVKNQADVVG